ncbi:ArsR/SmtB family transcription factor [Catelliglobosispora koreensis]|uniref:ArsR/SmtB family transcription factor n=1 Tax=Catelliglobosispora koreensis TaxID=129052 RepID=UPI000378BEFE|nr:winged helix-turn-helix domain-containing protein [Catelliglobosispora koreensis]
MQRIEFTADDLMRTGVINAGSLAETLFALRTLQSRRTPLLFGTWRRRARREIGGPAQHIAELFHPNGMLDLMTILSPASQREHAAAAVAGAPAPALRRELEHLARISSLPSWTSDLARGRRAARARLAAGVDNAFSGTISNLWPRMKRHLDAHRLRYVEAMALGGVEGLFSCLAPHVRWRAPVLEVVGAPVPGAARLLGRGLQIAPSVFCYRPEFFWQLGGDGPALLFVPALDDPVTALEVLTGPDSQHGMGHLHALIGRSRAAVLEVIATEPGITTGLLATRLGLSAPSTSEHATVLRQAGLVESRRHRNTVRHNVTALGRAMLGYTGVTAP